MPETPLRRDAERNRQLLLSHAGELMAREGLGVTYEQIARAAGTGMGTVYRRFPERSDLVDALFAEHIDAVVGLAREASAYDDAWEGVCWFMVRQFELERDNRALGELLRGGGQSSELVARGRREITPHVTGLVERAVAAGQLPPTTGAGDLVLVHLMVGAVMDATRGSDDRLWRRALHTALAGVRTATHAEPPFPDTAIDRLYGPTEETP
ncbi:TetR family transcriptional regulator [Nocardioides flavescens]